VLATLCASLALLAPGAALSSLIASMAPIAPPKAYRADRALAGGDLITAAAESRAELAVSPLRQDAWLRLAAIDLAQHHQLTAQGVAALDHAYDALPYDLDPQSARLRFALAQFQSLTPDVQASVRAELTVWANSMPLRAALQALRSTLRNPAGQSAIRLALDAPILSTPDLIL